VGFPRGVLATHFHDLACLTVVLSGSFTEYFAGHQATCNAGSVLFKPAGERHRDEFAGSQQVIVEPDAGAATALGEASALFDCIGHDRSGVAFAIASRVAREIQRPDPFSALSVEGLTLELLVAVLRAGRGPRPTSRSRTWLARVREQIETSEGLPQVASLAAEAQVHPAYLARVFRRCYGISIGQYARRVRLEWIARQLTESREPISALAFRAGFADQSHLTRAFRQRWGVTPRQYRLARKPAVDPDSP
jgi:AraC family transcriptional regulator